MSEDLRFENQKIINVELEKEMKSSFIDYAMSVIVARALPDVRDGLKPVHRGILYAMYEDHLTSDRPYRKGLSQEIACNNLIEGKGTQFDPEIVDAFIASLEKK